MSDPTKYPFKPYDMDLETTRSYLRASTESLKETMTALRLARTGRDAARQACCAAIQEKCKNFENQKREGALSALAAIGEMPPGPMTADQKLAARLRYKAPEAIQNILIDAQAMADDERNDLCGCCGELKRLGECGWCAECYIQRCKDADAEK